MIPISSARTPLARSSLTRWYSCPQWLADMWRRAYGEADALAYLKAQLNPPALGINLFGHPEADELYADLAALPEVMDIEGMSFAPAARHLLRGRTEAAPGPTVLCRPAGHRAASPLSSWPEPVWDACAGRGGKTRILREKDIDALASDIHRGTAGRPEPRTAGCRHL